MTLLANNQTSNVKSNDFDYDHKSINKVQLTSKLSQHKQQQTLFEQLVITNFPLQIAQRKNGQPKSYILQFCLLVFIHYI